MTCPDCKGLGNKKKITNVIIGSFIDTITAIGGKLISGKIRVRMPGKVIAPSKCKTCRGTGQVQDK